MEFFLSNSDSITCNLANSNSKFVKISIVGSLSAKSKDSKLLIRINGAAQSYRSFVIMDGNSGAGEWDETGIYLGRNGWSLDADFSAYANLSYFEGSQKILSSGSSVFAMGDNRILGYTNQGFYVSNTGISKVDIVFVGGGIAKGVINIE